MKPRVVLLSQEVHPIPPLKGAAVEQWIDAVAARLDGFEPHVVSVPHPDLPDRQVVGGVHYRRIRIGAAYKRLFRKLTRLDPYPYVARVARYACEIEADIIHVHNAPHFVDPLMRAAPAARMLLHMHNEKDPIPPSRVDLFAGCSAYIVDWFRRRQLRAGDFTVLPNGVDPARFAPSGETAVREARARFGLPPGRTIILYVGRISPEKGPDLLVAAFRRLDPRNYHLVLAGEWPRADPRRSERAAFAQRLKEQLAGLPVTVIDGVAPAEMPGIYRLGDMVVIPSRFEEPFSMVAIEAMACGVPVLALRKGGMAEYLQDGENAIVLPSDSDAASIAEAIEAARLGRDTCDRIAQTARRFVQGRFAWEIVVEATERAYRSVLGAR